jgi:hypothetical protein
MAFGFPHNQNFQPVPGVLGTQNAEGGRWAAASAFAEGMSGGPVYIGATVVGLVKGGLEGTNAVQWVTPIRHANSFLLSAGFVDKCEPVAISSPCSPPPQLKANSDIEEIQTKNGQDSVKKRLAEFGVGAASRTSLDSILKDYPAANQSSIVLTFMYHTCQMVWSDQNLSGSEKAERYAKIIFQLGVRASGPSPVARTDRRGALDAYFILAANDRTGLASDNWHHFLRDTPYYINDYNKYFVIVGDAPTREEGLSAIRRLKEKAPQWDFVLYEPYGANTNYGIMMATWVPHEVALEALRLARRYVAHDAFIWACRSAGDSC